MTQSCMTLRNGIALEPSSPTTDDADNDIADQRGSKTRTESSTCGDGPCYSNTIAESPRANCKDDYDLGQRVTRQSKMKSRKSALENLCSMFQTGSAAAVWIMMALTVATSSLAGATCIGTEVELDKGEAALRCPLTPNFRDTGQGIIIKHFPETGSDPVTVMSCYWPEEADEPECYSSDGFTLVGQPTDQVLSKVPVSRLREGGAYKIQLPGLGDQQYFAPCHIHRFSINGEAPADDVPVTKDNQRTAVTPSPVVSSTTKGRKSGKDPPNREAPPCVGQSSSNGLTAAVLVLTIIIIILLVINFFCLPNRNKLQATGQRTALMCPQ